MVPLPEDPADPVLTRMLAPTPYQMPVEEDKAESGKTKGGLHPEGISNIVSGGIRIPSSEDKSEGGVNVFRPMVRKGLPPKTGKERLLSESRCPSRAARA